jgi:MFS family permease
VNQRAFGFPRVVYVAIALVVLLAVVAFASRGHAPATGGSAQARGPVQVLFDVVFTLAFVVGIAGVVLMAFVRAQATERKREVSFRSIVIIALGVAAFMVFAILFGQHLGDQSRRVGGAAGGGVGGAQEKVVEQAKEPSFHWSIALGTVALLAAALLVLILRERRRRRASARERALTERLLDVLDETLDDLRAEEDPRKAVIGAYSKMERTLAARGIPRHKSEAPVEYLTRILDVVSASGHSVRRLTGLFSRARYSPHEIDAQMKEDAIDALTGLRAELAAP